jgi:PPOX class probable F420-dependent enzyme
MGNETKGGEFSELSGHEYINLITFREDTSSAQTTVRFVVVGDYVYIQTPRSAGKVRRIQATGRVLVAPSNSDGTPLGRTVLGLGRVIEGKEAEAAAQAMQAKYGQAHTDFLTEMTRERQDWEIIEIRPWDE